MTLSWLKVFLSVICACLCTTQSIAQPGELSAALALKNSDDEIRQYAKNRSESDLRSLIHALIARGESPDLGKDFAERLRMFRLARDTAKTINYNRGEVLALYAQGGVLTLDGQPKQALEFLSNALALAKLSNEQELQVKIAGSIAIIYRNLADYDKALEYYNLALSLCEGIEKSDAASILDGIGAISMYRGDYNTAETAHRLGLAIAEKSEDYEKVAAANFHLGIIYRLRGNYGEALSHYQKANLYPTTTVWRHIGGTYFLQGNLRLALDHAQKALALDEKRDDPIGIPYSLQFVAVIRVAEKNYREALQLAIRTEPMFEKLGDKDGLTRSIALLGSIYLALGEHAKSLEYFRRALDLRAASGSRDGMAIARIGIARNLLARGELPEALEHARQAVESTRSTGNRELLWQAQSLTGQISMASKDDAGTREFFDAAIVTIESLRGEIVGGAGDSTLFFAERIKPYQQLAAKFATNDPSRSFEYAERAKARVLLDAVRSGRNHQTSRMNIEEKAEENRLRAEVNTLNAQLSKLSDPFVKDRERSIVLAAKAESARTALSRFQANLYAIHPELRAKRGAVEPIKISEVAGLVDNDSALVEYLVSEDSILLYAFTKSGEAIEFKTAVIDIKREDLRKKIARFRQKLAERNVLFASASRDLYDLLVRPIAAQLVGKAAITFLPDDALWELPFGALQSGENKYVIDDASVSYAPSLTALRELRSSLRPAAGTLLAFGNPTTANSKVNTSFTSLPEAERQTQMLGTLYGGGGAKIFNRREADESVLKREAAAGFGVLHLATHGVLDNESPLNSYVLLAPNAQTGDDGRLEAWEILEMDLSSDLVFLSACETARGRVRSGEGLIGLSWSLMVAGARNVVVSQWKVESSSTTDLAISFYRSLKQNGPPKKAEALRQAALKLRRNAATAHPFYWAGFVLIGEAR